MEDAQRATPTHGNELEILRKEIEQLEEVRQKLEIELSGLKTDAQERKTRHDDATTGK
ncbi:MAG: hypothetical protein U5K54_11945 [Cytophagales bacterium]|nr:hypothetical protein [Cytophagales bacterium]